MNIEFAQIAHAERLDALRPTWDELLARFGSDAAMYQSHRWFEALLRQGHDRTLGLAVLNSDGAVRGLCPFRVQPIEVGFDVAGRTRAARRFQAATVLGGAPLWDDSDPRLTRRFIRAVFDHYPAVDAIHVPDVSASSWFWRAVEAAQDIGALEYLRGPFHTLAMPATLAEHQKRFSSKRRYNYRREQRLLEEGTGALLVEHRVCTGADLRACLDRVDAARSAATSPAEVTFLNRVAQHLGESFEQADAGLFRSTLWVCGNRVVVLVLAYQFGTRVHVHVVRKNPELLNYSPGSLAVYLFGLSLYAPDGLKRPQPVDVMYGFGSANQTHLPHNLIETRSRFLLLRPTLGNSLFWLTHRGVDRAKQLYNHFAGRKKRPATEVTEAERPMSADRDAPEVPNPPPTLTPSELVLSHGLPDLPHM
ncbi:GNAT family N-acetyltransferase [Frigoriglobus tundricola]|uniref:BioF2-like acetyltransferase domain-containing protein n=1 Tax=Frigoriglobus tundricola TaxID=2774151 RepID=A0A6M5Z4A6_9BACT|nr:GNAT family N-acetyltransferase [Frigoriglobus tundricola]QJX00926.1 hypothetical protein FTUN_8564 [Frigoriglobus tundricola]